LFFSHIIVHDRLGLLKYLSISTALICEVILLYSVPEVYAVAATCNDAFFKHSYHSVGGMPDEKEI